MGATAGGELGRFSHFYVDSDLGDRAGKILGGPVEVLFRGGAQGGAGKANQIAKTVEDAPAAEAQAHGQQARSATSPTPKAWDAAQATMAAPIIASDAGDNIASSWMATSCGR